jgi:hypothetical protein
MLSLSYRLQTLAPIIDSFYYETVHDVPTKRTFIC